MSNALLYYYILQKSDAEMYHLLIEVYGDRNLYIGHVQSGSGDLNLEVFYVTKNTKNEEPNEYI